MQYHKFWRVWQLLICVNRTGLGRLLSFLHLLPHWRHAMILIKPVIHAEYDHSPAGSCGYIYRSIIRNDVFLILKPSGCVKHNQCVSFPLVLLYVYTCKRCLKRLWYQKNIQNMYLYSFCGPSCTWTSVCKNKMEKKQQHYINALKSKFTWSWHSVALYYVLTMHLL